MKFLQLSVFRNKVRGSPVGLPGCGSRLSPIRVSPSAVSPSTNPGGFVSALQYESHRPHWHPRLSPRRACADLTKGGSRFKPLTTWIKFSCGDLAAPSVPLQVSRSLAARRNLTTAPTLAICRRLDSFSPEVPPTISSGPVGNHMLMPLCR